MATVVGFSLWLLIVCLCFTGVFAAVFDVTNFGARADGRTDDRKVSHCHFRNNLLMKMLMLKILILVNTY